MLEKPKKALYYKELEFNAVATGSGHTVSTVTFIDADGIEKEGHFKHLDSTYPALLAKYNVAISVLARNFLGDDAAEDRLVLDDQGNVVGTVSLNLVDEDGKPAYKPLLDKVSDSFDDAVKILLDSNVAKVLVLFFVLYDEDRHPCNFSLDKALDWDMAFYHITHIIKGGRFIDGLLRKIPEKEMSLKKEDLSNAPILNRTHHPTQTIPGTYNVYKLHQSADVFQFLATNPELMLDENTKICFQEQYFSALLQWQLVFDPDILGARLKEYIGEEILLDFIPPEELDSKDVDSGKFLAKTKAERLMREKSEFFSKETNTKPFINHIMAVFQEAYDELYRVLVYYEGCESNIKATSVMSFNDFLRHRPSAYKSAAGWMDSQNKKIEVSLERQREVDSGKSPEKPKSSFTSYSNSMPPEAHYNLNNAVLLYHQIWRDSNTNALNSILLALDSLNETLSRSLNKTPIIIEDYQPSNSETKELTEGWQCIENRQKSAEELLAVHCDEENEVFKELGHLVQFTEEFRGLSNIYWMIPYSTHPIKAQQETDADIRKKTQKTFATAPWIDELFTILKKHLSAEQSLLIENPSLSKMELFLILRKIIKPSAELNIALNKFYIGVLDKLSQKHPLLINNAPESQEWKDRTANIFEDLKVFRFNMGLERHLSSQDTTLETVAKASISAQLMRSHTDPDVISECFRQLLAWANNYDNLDGQILGALSTYSKNSYRQGRVIDIETYLKNNKDDGITRLLTIFSTGGTESTSFNTRLLENLVPIMLKDTCGQVGDNMLCLRDAVAQGSFNAEVYAKAMQTYVLNNESLNHIYSVRKVRLLNELIYNWVEKQPGDVFNALVEKSIQTYLTKRSSMRTLYSFFTAGFLPNSGREQDIRELFKKSPKYSNRKILSEIFRDVNGGVEENSINTIIFTDIWDKMQQEVRAGVEPQSQKPIFTETEQFILQVSSLIGGKQPPMIFLNSLKAQAAHFGALPSKTVEESPVNTIEEDFEKLESLSC